MFCKSKMSRKDRQQWKLKMYSRWEDAFVDILAGVKAAKAKLEEQIKRDATDRLHDDIRGNNE